MFELPLDWHAAGLGDIDCDGRPDLAVGASWYSPELQQFACVYSGRTGTLNFRFRPPTCAGFEHELGLSFGPVGDIDGDSYPDFAVGSWSSPGTKGRYRGLVEIRSGYDGRRITGIEGEGDYACLGWTLVPIGDLDGDGRPDLLVGASNRYVDVLSGSDLHRIHRVASRGGYAICDSFASSLDVVGDVDGDGVPDWVVGANEDARMFDEGYAEVVSGRTGRVLRNLFDAEDTGADVCGIGDVDLDGVPDIVLATETKFLSLDSASGSRDTNPAIQRRQVQVISGRTWTTLWQVDVASLRKQMPQNPARK
jgi:hypothetical protein